MGKIRKGRSQREDVAVINNEWVARHQHLITPRDMQILRLLNQYPVMTIQHIVELTPSTPLKNGRLLDPFYVSKKAEQICRDRIRRLYDLHFVNKFSPQLGLGEGTSPQFIWLDRAGYKLLGREGRPPKQLSAEYKHHQSILDIICLFRSLERHGEIKIDYLSSCYTDKPQTTRLEPDIMVCFQKGNFGYRFIIEVDLCEKKESDELSKLQKYRDWELGSQWIREPWSNIYRRRFPTVFYLFKGNERKVNRRIQLFNDHAVQIELKARHFKYEDFSTYLQELQR